MGFAIIMWFTVVVHLTPQHRRILCSVAQGPQNIPFISALGEAFALNQSVRSLNLPQICLLVNLQCQIEFSWTATLPWQMWQCDPISCAEVSECVSSNRVAKSQLPLDMNIDERSCQRCGSGWLDCYCCLGQRMLNECRFQQTTQLSPPLTVALFGVTLIQLHCPYIISDHLCCSGTNLEQGQCWKKSQGFNSRNNESFICLWWQGHRAETSSDATHDNTNVRGDESPVRMAWLLCHRMTLFIWLNLTVWLIL